MRYTVLLLCFVWCTSFAQESHSWQTPMGLTCYINGFVPAGNELYVAVNNAGIFSRRNKSEVWQTQNSGLPPYSILNVHSNGATVFTYEYYGTIYKRNSPNEPWQVCQPLPYTVTGSDSSINIVGMFTTQFNWTFVCTSRGVYLYEGNSWKRITTDFDGRILVQYGATLYAAGTGGGVYRSDDTAKSWQAVNKGLVIHDTVNNRDYTPYVVSLVQQGSVLLAGCVEGLFRSVNNGAQWQRVESAPIKIGPMCITHDTITWCGSENLLLRSGDSGRSWNKQVALVIPSDRRISALYSSGDSIYVGCGHSGNWNDFVGGMYFSSDNGSTWRELTTPTPRSYQSLDFDYYPTCYTRDSLYWYVGSTGDGVYRSPDKGKTWTQTRDTLHNPITTMATYNGVVYAGTTDGLYYSTNYGTDWHFARHEFATSYHTIYGVSVVRDTVAVLTKNGMWFIRGVDTNRFLKLLKTNLNELTVLATINDTVYASTSSTLYRSGDIGRSWKEIRNTATTTGTITGIISNGNALLLSTTKGVWCVTGDSTQWIQRNNGLTIDGAGTLPIVSSITNFGKHVYVSIFSDSHPEKSGVYESTDNGITWYHASDGLTHRSVVALEVMDSILVAAVDSKEVSGSGVWWLRLPYSPLTDVIEDIPQQQADITIVPQPVNDILHIYTTAIPLSCTLYTITGRALFTSSNPQQPFLFDTSLLPSGCYIVTLCTQTGVVSQKILVLH